MSRAFVNEDAQNEPAPTFHLPDPDSEHFEIAAAWALLEGANRGDTRSAEQATGIEWGDPRLIPPMEDILASTQDAGEDRLARLARRYLRHARRDV